MNNRYIYETHLHTSEGSACGRAKAVDIVHAYKDAGYTGIIITDHFFYGNTAVDRSLPWKDWVNGFCKGYENALEEGRRVGLQVFSAGNPVTMAQNFLYMDWIRNGF